MTKTCFTVRLAGVNVAVAALWPETRDFCADYLTQGAADFSVELFPEDIAAERQRADAHSLIEFGQVVDYSDQYLEMLALYRKIADRMFDYDTLLFHGSAIALEGEVYLFTAPSGTGKSTHTRLWREHFGERAFMVNDDKPLLRITEEGVWVCGTPWDGKHRLSRNVTLPLKAICALERSEVNRIRPEKLSRFFAVALQQTYQSEGGEHTEKTLELLEKLLTQVGLYRLGCNMEREAAVVAFEGMRNLE